MPQNGQATRISITCSFLPTNTSKQIDNKNQLHQINLPLPENQSHIKNAIKPYLVYHLQGGATPCGFEGSAVFEVF